MLSIFALYWLSCLAGMVMVHRENNLALVQRDRIVATALKTDKASLDYQAGNKFSAAIRDCAGNILYAAVPQTVIGLGVVFPYFTVAYQGWIGGIVSVDGNHRSRLRTAASAAYYLIVLLMQYVPFSLCIGAGVRCGVDLYRHNSAVSWKLWNYRFPAERLRDVGVIFLFSIPLFFIASCFEFMSGWNM